MNSDLPVPADPAAAELGVTLPDPGPEATNG